MIYDIQRASVLKRASAFLLDAILFSIIATGVAYLFSIIMQLDAHQDKLQEYYDYYESTYNVSFDLSQEDFDKMSPEEHAHYEEVEEILIHDENVVVEYNKVINYTLVVIFAGVFFGVMIVEFVFPLIFRNGQTVGKKIFSLCVVKNNGVKISGVQLFIRTVFGKFAIELILPIYLLIMAMYGIIGLIGPVIIIGIAILQLALIISTKNRTMIHDSLAFTVVVDKQSQMIFDSDNDLLLYKQKIHKEMVSKEEY